MSSFFGWLRDFIGRRRVRDDKPDKPEASKANGDRVCTPIGRTLYEDRCIGVMLGVACGDILGANVEFSSREAIRELHGRVENFLDSDWRPFGQYTDDTEMTLALATSLIRRGTVDAEDCARAYAEFFGSESRRGYGPGVSQLLEMLRQGADYRQTGRAVHSTGSYGNGGAMRIGPLGLAFRNASAPSLREAVRCALLCTHVHPEAVDGALIQALAVARLSTTVDASSLEENHFLTSLHATAQTPSLRDKLAVILDASPSTPDETILAAVCTPSEFGEQFQIRATEAVTCALWAFIRNWPDPEECLVRAVGLGGDTDTVAALAGALVGALHGTSWIPLRWYENIENTEAVGRDGLIQIGRQLARLDIRS